jgi:glycosyltransferase involved in cell wall biosynthesis
VSRRPRKPLRRVLIVSPQPFYEDRGTPIAVGQLATALTELGFDVDLLAYPVGTAVNLSGLRILRCANPFGFRRVRIGFSLRKVVLDICMAFALGPLLRTQRYDVVHVLEEMAFLVVPACRRRGIPVIYDMQSSLPDQLRTHAFFRLRWVNALARRMEHSLFRRADSVICSAGLLDYVRKVEPAAKVAEWRFAGQRRLTDPAQPSRLREQLGLAPDARVILYSGTFEPYQGLDFLMGAIRPVVERIASATFVMIGAMPDDDLPRQPFAAEWIRQGRLHVLPRQPRADVPAYLAMADVLVSPRAYGDNVPLKIFDYMVSGKPIVATDLRAHRSILNERTALLVEIRSEAIAAAIIRLMEDRELAGELSMAALQEAARYPGAESFVHLVNSLYEGVLEGAGESR